jgi:hypothetical protein
MSTKLRRLILAGLIALLPTLAMAQTLNSLGGVTIGTPGSGQSAQNFTYSCSVSGCATGTVVAAFAPTQGNALLSATNGGFTNLLVANVAESATNGMFANQLQGNAVLSVANPAFTAVSDGTTKATVNAGDGGLTVHVANTNANGSAVSASSSPVVIASDQVAVPIKAASASIAAGAYASGSIGSGAIASGAIAAGASAGDPCMFGTKINLPISTNATALTQIIALSGSTKIYICSINLVAPGATAFNLVGGTGTNCAAAAVAIMGSTTAANGMSWAANGGFTLGNGSGVVGFGAAGSELCTLQSNAVQVAGNLTYVQQ